jgi:hypothetical protein
MEKERRMLLSNRPSPPTNRVLYAFSAFIIVKYYEILLIDFEFSKIFILFFCGMKSSKNGKDQHCLFILNYDQFLNQKKCVSYHLSYTM